MEFKEGTTDRGFDRIGFTDAYGTECSIQKSSMTIDAIWLGVDNANPQILSSKFGVGFIPYEIPQDVSLTTRMHLTQEQVKAILPILTTFAETGELPKK
jgi:hypothetical protein